MWVRVGKREWFEESGSYPLSSRALLFGERKEVLR